MSSARPLQTAYGVIHYESLSHMFVVSTHYKMFGKDKILYQRNHSALSMLTIYVKLIELLEFKDLANT